jgi:glutamate/tyrosine decarboxylase-like PLP-dependent enzyme
MRLARVFSEWVDRDPNFERLAPVLFSVVCFRARPQALDRLPPSELDLFNERLLDEVNRSGDVFLSHTRINGVVALRLAIGHMDTAERHIARAWELLRAHTEQLAAVRS